MADATMERSLAAAIDSSVCAAAADTLIWLVPPPAAHYQHQHPVDIDGDGHTTTAGGEDDDVVAGLLDEFIPRDSDLDEQIIECPMIQRVLLLAMASLQQQLEDIDDIQMIASQQLEAYHPNGAVPAPAAAVANLGKQTFFCAAGAGGDGGGGSVDHQSRDVTCICSICLEGFEDGQEISVMPCSGRHGFHTYCITKWLGQYSNACPLCRHVLPIVVDDDQ